MSEKKEIVDNAYDLSINKYKEIEYVAIEYPSTLEIMTELRENPPKEIDGHKVLSFRDYKADTVKDIETGEVKPTGLPNSNVLYFDMSDNVWMCVRPSGTEPKIKFYYGVVGESLEDADKKSEAMAQAVTDMVAKMS